MKRLVPTVVLLLAGCDLGKHGGTSVGNPPGFVHVEATDEPAGVDVEEAELGLRRIVLTACERGGSRVRVDATLDLLDPAGQDVPIPGGTWCGVDFHLERDGLFVAGATDGGTAFTVVLDPEVFELRGRIEVNANSFVMAIPLESFLFATDLENRGDRVDVDPDDGVADTWADVAAANVVLYEDGDDDRRVTADDHPIAWPDRWIDDDTDQFLDAAPSAQGGSGCSTVAPAGGVAGLLLLLALVRRRRRAIM